MRTLLLGTDFMYNANGDLVPIEINTNVNMNSYNVVEERKDIINFTAFRSLIEQNNFTKLTYIGNMTDFHRGFQSLAEEYGMTYDFYAISGLGRHIPDLEDTPDHLIVRSSYDLTAIVDEEYCKIKTNFLELIQNTSFGQQFAYKDDYGNLISNITTIRNNGDNPNFILKSIFPEYDRQIYPKFYKVSNQGELDIILQNVNAGYFLMEFHYNSNKLYQNNMKMIRSYNLLIPPNLSSISLGQYTMLSTLAIDGQSTYNTETFELDAIHRNKYIAKDDYVNAPKLQDTDQVEMSDGTFKSAIDLQVGDLVKSVAIPNPHGVDVSNPLADFGITFAEFQSGATYTSNLIIDKRRIDKLVQYIKITFTDGTTWEDTINSSYLSLRNDDVRFLYLNSGYGENGLQKTDQLILVQSADSSIVPVLKTMESYEITKVIFSGWEITIDVNHNFLTKTSESTASYVAIEHNPACSSPCGQSICVKGYVCCPDINCYGALCQIKSNCNQTYWNACCKA